MRGKKIYIPEQSRRKDPKYDTIFERRFKPVPYVIKQDSDGTVTRGLEEILPPYLSERKDG